MEESNPSTKIRIVICGAVLLLLLSGVLALFAVRTSLNQAESQNGISSKLFETTLSRVTLPFIQNEGQALEQIQFYSDTFATHLAVTDTYLTYTTKDHESPTIFRESFINSNKDIQHLSPSGVDSAQTNVAYFKGNNQETWHSNIPAFNILSLGEVWDNVEIELKARGLFAEKYFHVLPGGNVSDIKVNLEGIAKMMLDSEGNLLLTTEEAEFKLSRPLAYQPHNDKMVQAQYTVIDESTYGFQVSDYDQSQILTIDPILYSTYFGSDNLDFGYAINAHGDSIYISGGTGSNTFVTEFGDLGGYDNSHAGDYDQFVARFDSTLTHLESWTLLGGTNREDGASVAIQDDGTVIIAGCTNSPDFPTTSGVYDTTHNGNYDFFISKLSADLSSLIESTYLGGSQNDSYPDIALTPSGNLIIGGTTASSDYPQPPFTSGYDQNCGSDGLCDSLTDNVLSLLSNDLTTLVETTFIGGSGDESKASIVSYDNSVYIVSRTTSSDYPFPALSSGFDQSCGTDGSCNGTGDVVVSRVSWALVSLMESSYFGGEGDEDVESIFADTNGIYIAGNTLSSANPPVTGGAYDTTFNGVRDGFVAKFNTGLNSLIGSTLLGGSSLDYANAVQTDSSGNLFVVGKTLSNDFPTITGVYDETHNGSYDFFVSRLNPSLTGLTSSTYIGGDTIENFPDLMLDDDENVILVGSTDSDGTYPITPGAFQETYDPEDGGSYWDVIITILDPDLSALALDHFEVTGLASQEPGTSQTITITAYGNDNRVWTSYTGDHDILFSGARTAEDGSAPTCTDKNGINHTFGEPTTLVFTYGVATCDLTLYVAETASIDVTDGEISTFANPDYDLDITLTEQEELPETGRSATFGVFFGIITVVTSLCITSLQGRKQSTSQNQDPS